MKLAKLLIGLALLCCLLAALLLLARQGRRHLPAVDLRARYRRVFPAGKPFTTERQAALHMKTVTVEVWTRDPRTGRKQRGTRRVTVNEKLAGEVQQIFHEIARDPERFPIKRLEGYSFRRMRGYDMLSHHSFGTALDINADENMYISRSTGMRVGRCWLPGRNPYSIPPNGSVLRVFRRHGWFWGGDSPDPTDYMHFSYLGG